MTAAETTTASSFVVLQLGSRLFALPSETVIELAPPVRLHRFPHTSRLLSGVIVRRGRIVPVYDAASVLIGRSSSGQRFYLIARRSAEGRGDFVAIPVNGECELATGEMLQPSSDRPAWVIGTLLIGRDTIDVLDFGALATSRTGESQHPSVAELPS